MVLIKKNPCKNSQSIGQTDYKIFFGKLYEYQEFF